MSDHQNGDILPIEFMARKEDWNFGISLYARQVIYGVRTSMAQAMVFEAIEDGAFSSPFAQLDIGAAQQLMDELWRCGVRPTEGTGSAGSLAATERHLGDMQAIAFKMLNIPGGKKSE